MRALTDIKLGESYFHRGYGRKWTATERLGSGEVKGVFVDGREVTVKFPVVLPRTWAEEQQRKKDIREANQSARADAEQRKWEAEQIQGMLAKVGITLREPWLANLTETPEDLVALRELIGSHPQIRDSEEPLTAALGLDDH